MIRHLYHIMLLVCVLVAAPQSSKGQINLSNHIWWDATGTQKNENWGFSGLDYIGETTGGFGHSSSIGSFGTSGFVLNRFLLDTVPQYHFPGARTYPGHIRSSTSNDVVVWNQPSGVLTVLLGTTEPFKFDTAMVLRFSAQDRFNFDNADVDILVYDCDGDSHDDILLSERQFSEPPWFVSSNGRLRFFHGGTQMDTTPALVVKGRTEKDFVGGGLLVGHFRSPSELNLVEVRWYYSKYESDTVSLISYRIGNSFDLVPLDTTFCNISTGGTYNFGLWGGNIDSDSLDEVLLGCWTGVLAYHVIPGKKQQPFRSFPRPFTTNSTTFGSKIVDVGNVADVRYHSFLVADPEASDNNKFNGAVFLYNIGAGLDTHCVASFSSTGFESYFGAQACKVGDINGDGLDDFFVAEDDDPLLGPPHRGGIRCFLGNAQYATPVGVREVAQPPTQLYLTSPFPNPAKDWTDVRIGVKGIYDSAVELALYDCLGRKVSEAFHGIVDGYGYTVRIPVALLATGVYTLVLKGSARITEKKLSIIH